MSLFIHKIKNTYLMLHHNYLLNLLLQESAYKAKLYLKIKRLI